MNKNSSYHKPFISVVMATYNGELFIDEAIQSVLDQSYENFEFIIVDDGSTDRTAHHIASFNDDRILYFKKENNTGIADSLNIGISKAKGKYIARMDDDDVCMPNRFKEQIAVLEENSNIMLCASNVLLINADKHNHEHENHEDLKMKLLFNNAIVHPTVMLRKDVLLKHLYRKEKVPSEDYDLWSRLIWEGEFYKIIEPLLFYRYRKLSETSRRRKEQLILNVEISKYMFDKIGFTQLDNNEENIRVFASRDYSISGKDLKGLINWFKSLKQTNINQGIFQIEKFNNLSDANLERFLIAYFTNRKLVKKIVPFFNLNRTNKKLILNYYFSKLI